MRSPVAHDQATVGSGALTCRISRGMRDAGGKMDYVRALSVSVRGGGEKCIGPRRRYLEVVQYGTGAWGELTGTHVHHCVKQDGG